MIKFSFEGKDYELEFSRATAKIAEKKFDISLKAISEMQVSCFDDMFYCAFLMHHPNIKRELADRIFESIGNKQGLVMALYEMYAETVNTLIEEPEEGNAIVWELVS